jgi:hypothetical protein
MMTKPLIFFVLCLYSAIIPGCGKKEGANLNKNSDEKYIAYYFHPTARCESCINLENYIKELIETKYTDKGFSFKEVNIDLKENEHFRNDYDLKFSSVILVNTNSNKWKNLYLIWSYTDDKEKFLNYAESEINNFINPNVKKYDN